MKHLFTIIAMMAVACGVLLTGCKKEADGANYTVTVTLDGTASHDSATLLVLEPDYNKLRDCGTVARKNGTFTFTGQADESKAALIRWADDTITPFYFVLERGDIHITIGRDRWDITGSAQNSQYLHYINRRNALLDARVATWQEYLKMAADSSLRRDDERRMVRQDSLLNDSLQRITVERINRGDAVGRIIRERFAAQLDTAHARQLR